MEDMQQMNSGKTYALDSFATLVKVILLLNLVSIGREWSFSVSFGLHSLPQYK